MTLVRRPLLNRTISAGAIAGAFVIVVALTAGQVALAEVIGGALLISASVLTGSSLTRRAADEKDPRKLLFFDFLLVLVVVLGLGGVAVMGLAIR